MLIVLERAGHCPMDEEPDKVRAEMVPWHASLPSFNKFSKS